MRTLMTGDEFGEALATYTVSAFRLEQQPAYAVTVEADNLAAFLAGQLISPANVPGWPQWSAMVSAHTAAGRIMTRVRVQDVPPTDYQRWLRWGDDLNTAAGEVIQYVDRPAALAAGFTPLQGDWWLLDSTRLIVMIFDGQGSLVEMTVTDDPNQVADAIRQRDLALQISVPKSS